MIVLVLEVIAIFTVAILSFDGFFDPMRRLTKIGIWMITCGLFVQVIRTLHYFEVGSYPVDTYFPLWVTKDIGACLIVLDLALLSLAAKDKP